MKMSRRCRRPALLLLWLLVPGAIFARPQQSEKNAQVVQLQQAILGQSTGPVKCGLPAAMQFRLHPQDMSEEQARFLAGTLQRPDFLDRSYVSEHSHFKIHYTLTGRHRVDSTSTIVPGVPDYVYEAAAAAERAYFLLVDSLGFRPHLSDSGIDGPEYDIYLQNLGSVYGWTYTEDAVSTSPFRYPAYSTIENDFIGGFFTTGLNALHATVVHEYFHAVQFAYAYRDEDLFFFEMSSTWFEELAFDEVNDYLSYLPSFFRNLDLPLHAVNSTHEYGASIWLMYWLADRDIRSLRRMWEGLESQQALNSIAAEVKRAGMNMPQVMGEFYSWCLFTGPRALPGEYFRDAVFFPEVWYSAQDVLRDTATVAGTLFPLSARYYRYYVDPSNNISASFQHEQSPNLRLIAAPEDTFNSLLGKVALRDVATPYYLSAVRNDGAVTVGIVNGNMPGDLKIPYRQLQKTPYELLLSTGALTNVPAGLRPPWPNPFHPGVHSGVTLFYNLKEEGELRLFIVAEYGKRIYQKDLGHRPPGPGETTWPGVDENGHPVPSGIYLVILQTDSGARFLQKLAVLEE